MYFARRMCKFTMRPINSRDSASVQLILAKLDENGRMKEEVDIIDISGDIRESGDVDGLLTDYAENDK